ncbi:MAG: hypothetical protein LBH60_08830 [Prevotellaceae bacterium]|jgi:hypothetical protein|nr:hypothetical protein [Prevotellaceae bacterium]
MTKLQKSYNRYSIYFKEQAVQEVTGGASISEVRRRYGILKDEYLPDSTFKDFDEAKKGMFRSCGAV